MNDLQNNIRPKVVILPVALGATGGITGTVIDRQGYHGVDFLVTYGAITTTGTAVAVVVKEGSVTGTLTSVADADLVGTEVLASMVAATPRVAGVGKEVVKRVGYKGTKQYVTIDLAHTGVSSAGGIVSVIALLHDPENGPTANP